ncbi:MAG: type 1 glutamine amidotransferase [Pseudomonadota bacterium]|nr:type 1 glutamine amidotransferase [Pseudomonadota bacterium]
MPTLTTIETGRPPKKMEGDWPDYPDMFEALLAEHLPDWQYRSIALCEGEPLPDPETLDAILITGSPAGVYEDEPWMPPLMDFIRSTANVQVPQIGVCFGHQAIAHALGAKVTKSEKGWGIGRHTYDIRAPQSWMGTNPPATFSLGVSHQDQVLTLPPGAQLVAQNAFCEYAALAYPAAKAISFQGHPEYSAAFSCALYGVRKGRQLPIQMVDAAEASLAEPLDNDLVGRWIAGFLKAALN